MELELSCPSRGFPKIRYYEFLDVSANLTTEVCSDVCIQDHLQPVTAENQKSVRLDVATNMLWSGSLERTYFNVRVFNPHDSSNKTTYRQPTTAHMKSTREALMSSEF